MLIIRLQRVGRRNHAEFRVVVTEHTRGPQSGNYLEVIGNYNPHTDAFSVNEESVKKWISNGAQVSDTLHNLLVTHKVIKGDKKNVLPKKNPIQKEAEEEVAEEASDEPSKEGDKEAQKEVVEKEAEEPKEEGKKEEVAA